MSKHWTTLLLVLSAMMLLAVGAYLVWCTVDGMVQGSTTPKSPHSEVYRDEQPIRFWLVIVSYILGAAAAVFVAVTIIRERFRSYFSSRH